MGNTIEVDETIDGLDRSDISENNYVNHEESGADVKHGDDVDHGDVDDDHNDDSKKEKKRKNLFHCRKEMMNIEVFYHVFRVNLLFQKKMCQQILMVHL